MKRGETPGIQLKDQAYRDLRRLLLTGEFPVGALLSERQLVARFRISKTPIRVALERLERDGFVEILPQRGVRVRGLTDKEIADHFDLREALETWVARRLCTLDEAPLWSELDAALDAQRAAIRTGDLEAFAHADASFHIQLAAFAENDEIVRIMRLQRERLFRIVLRILASDGERPALALSEHRAILDAVRERDLALALERIGEHLLWGRRFLARAPVVER